jgi:hypothetical protein
MKVRIPRHDKQGFTPASAFSGVTRPQQNGTMLERIKIFAVDESDELRNLAL